MTVVLTSDLAETEQSSRNVVAHDGPSIEIPGYVQLRFRATGRGH